MKRIVIMGGSFNPPTIAHYGLMKAAMDKLRAEKGIFVPVSFAYLKRKMMKNKSSFCLSEEERYQMLEAMCSTDQRMSISTLEYGLPCGRTYDTLMTIQKQYPQAQLFFIAGADKLELMYDFATKTDYFERFYVAVFSREGVDARQMVLSDSVLAAHAGRFEFFECPEEYLLISSTAIRQAMAEEKDYSAYLHPSVKELLEKVKLEDFHEEIVRFKGEYAFLDNLYPVSIEWEGITYPCVEAAFQASKTENKEIRRSFATCKLERIKEKGNKLSVTEEWEKKRLSLMKELLSLKFQSHSELAEELKATKDKILVNGNNGKDSFWGTSLYSWDGQNNLGKLLMEVRDEI